MRSTPGTSQIPDGPRVAIIGGGVTGLTAAYDLARSGRPASVTLYEGGPTLGGLAAGFRGRPEWEWPLEHFYHHLFTNDDAILAFTRELGLEGLLETHTPTTAMFYGGRSYPLDTPLRLLRFPHLPWVDRLRVGVVLAYLKYHPRAPWRAFDGELADAWLLRTMGEKGYRTLWQPMLQAKFGAAYDEVNLAWFWARIYKRTRRLVYYRGGFQAFVDGLAVRAREQGVALKLNTPVSRIRPQSEGGYLVEAAGKADRCDAVVSAVSPGLMQTIAPDLPAPYLDGLAALRSMGAIALTIALDRPLLTEGTYWINVPRTEGIPFLALVEHTNMIDPAHYAGDHLLYIGIYLDPGHRHFDLSADELLVEFLPHLSRFNPYFQCGWVTGAWVHKAKYAQPVPPVGYAAMIPSVRTPLPGLYFASMSQVYPWDRGTNYAVEMGRKVARLLLDEIG